MEPWLRWQLPSCPGFLAGVRADGAKSSSVTGGRLCTFAHLAVCTQHGREISEEGLWDHFSWHFSKCAWLPEVLTLWFCPCSEETVFFVQICGECVKDEAWVSPGPSFYSLVLFFLFTRQWHLQMEACWDSTWLMSSLGFVPLACWPLSSHLSRQGPWPPRGHQRSLQSGLCGPCFPTACHM